MNKNEPMPEAAIPEPPKHLSGAALAEWERIAPELFALGLLTRLDRAALGCYCASYARWQEAEEQLAESGLLVKSANGNIVRNPLEQIASQTMQICVKFASEFGFSPASRSKVTAKKRGGEESPWGKFGKRKKK